MDKIILRFLKGIRGFDAIYFSAQNIFELNSAQPQKFIGLATWRTKMEHGNLFAEIPATLAVELEQTLATGNGMRVERIVSRGHCSPPGFWYDQSDDEWVALLKGEARLRFEAGDRVVHLRAGDYVNIPAHEKHRVDWTAEGCDTVWLAVFY